MWKHALVVMLILWPARGLCQETDLYVGLAYGGVYSGSAYMALGLQAEVVRGPVLLSNSVRFLRGVEDDRSDYVRIPRHAGTPEKCILQETGEEVELGKCHMYSAGTDWGVSLTYVVIGDLGVGGAVHYIKGAYRPTLSLMMRRTIRDGGMGISFSFDWGFSPMYLSMSYIFSARL